MREKKFHKLFKHRSVQLSLMLIAGLFLGWLLFKPHQHLEKEQVQSEQAKETIYTCSMHPQIRRNGPGKCPICGMDLIPLAEDFKEEESNGFVYTMSPEAVALANIQTQKVKRISPEHKIYLTGKLAINEQKLAVITANFYGRIERMFVNFTGQTVRKGEKLATIYSPELITAQKELIEATKFKDINPVLYNASKEKLRLWKITESQINKIESSGIVQTEFDVLADQEGVVIKRNVAKGDYVNKGTVLFEIADLNNLWVLLDAYENELPFLKKGQKIFITVSSFPEREFETTISFIDPLINPQTRTASVRAELTNWQNILKPEMFVKGKVVVSGFLKESTPVIPKTSLLWTGKRSIAYVKIPGKEIPSFEMREISIGPSLGDYYVVKSGLTEGEEIVTEGVFAVDAAAQLKGNYSMMQRPQNKKIIVPDSFLYQLTTFIEQYFELKNNLVKSDFDFTLMSAKTLESKLNIIDMKQLDEDAHKVWMEYYSAIKQQLDLLKSSENIEEARKYFASLSEQLIKTIEIFGVKKDSIYVTYCPMAFNNKGAYWLSEFKNIKNPYFGNKMLTCGEVRKIIGGF